ncbi:MAG: hypothetical protein LBV79_06315 [Candidatus Adiutrix sp.]|jgi:hypothetical protein|nr:hypothetical protein [Candidatus Adiutrix sp.]
MLSVRNSLLLLAAVIFIVWGWYTAGLKSQRDKLSAELAVADRQSSALGRELRLSRQALEQREAERQQLAGEKAALLNTLQEVYADDENARAWAGTPCPDAVLECLRSEALPADPAHGAAGSVSPRN